MSFESFKNVLFLFSAVCAGILSVLLLLKANRLVHDYHVCGIIDDDDKASIARCLIGGVLSAAIVITSFVWIFIEIYSKM